MRKVMKGLIGTPTNQALVELWLKKNERNYSYIARHTGIRNTILTTFKQGRKVAPEVLIRIAEFTGLPLKVSFKGCRTSFVAGKER